MCPLIRVCELLSAACACLRKHDYVLNSCVYSTLICSKNIPLYESCSWVYVYVLNSWVLQIICLVLYFQVALL